MSYKGADYRKADLQLHSPRDTQWVGIRPDEKLPKGASEAEIVDVRTKWANDFINACVARGIQVAALTDHHEGVYCWYVVQEVKRRQEAEGLDFWFMPGMELTCEDNAQAIILFDADFTQTLFEKVRSVLRMTTDFHQWEPVGIGVAAINKNLNEIQKTLEDDPELKGRFIIFPNATSGGHKSILVDGHHPRFTRMPYVGVYLDRQRLNGLNYKAQSRLTGKAAGWAGGIRGVIATSDARSSNFSNIGSYATWLKMAAPTAESLRQAMLAVDSRILNSEPTQPSLYLKSITVTDAKFLVLGQPIEFSSQLNAVIGGRGSGKSTLLEYVRYTLGISALDIDSSNWDPTYERRRELLQETLGNATSKVELEVMQQGIIIQLVRHGGANRIYMQVDGKSFPMSLEDVRQKFSVQAYSQGELSHLGDNTADSRLFELITTPHRVKLNEVEDNIKQTAGELRKYLEQTVEFWRLEGERRKIDTRLVAITASIAHARHELGGLKAEVQTIINQHQEIVSADRWIERLNKDYQDTHNTLVSAFDRHVNISERHLKVDDIPPNDDAQNLATTLREYLDNINESYLKLLTAHQDFERQYGSIAGSWTEHKAAHNLEYAKALEESAQYTSRLEKLSQLEEQQNGELRKRENIIRQMEPLQDALSNLRKTGASYVSLQHELRRLSKISADQLANLTNNQARAELAPLDDFSELKTEITNLFYQSNVRSVRLENLLNLIIAKDSLNTWWEFLEELLTLLRWNITGLSETDQRPKLRILDETIEDGLKKFCEIFTVGRMTQIITAVIRPRMQLLQKRGNYEIAFGQASQGEKATILLNVLMRQPGGPLLLDQPEEDLDNRIIGDIVRAIQAAKNGKQLLFATHNANLVVNGDAELVVDLENGLINQIGAIDFAALRDSITETMEGGKEAFELRRRKYNF